MATLAYEYRAGFRVPEHAHGSDQLIYAIRGVMEVSSGQSMWLIPPHFGLWIPARTEHRIRMARAVSMRTLYFRRGVVSKLARDCAVLHISPLLRELIVEAVGIGRLRTGHRLERALSDLTVAHLESASAVPTFVKMPGEARAFAVAQAMITNPGRSETLATLCADAGVSARTIQRIFRREVGTDFEAWRRQVRVVKAVELLVAGKSVKEVAFAVGYKQCSAFVETFRLTFGTTPKAWVVGLEQLTSGVTV